MSEVRSCIQGDSNCHSLESVWSGNSSVSEEMQGGRWDKFIDRSLKELLRMCDLMKGHHEQTQRGDQATSSSSSVDGNYKNLSGVKTGGQGWETTW